MNLAFGISAIIAAIVPVSVAAQDTARSLSALQLMQIVKQNHPIAKQASLLIDKAKADLTIARGGFDPFLYSGTSEKVFAGVDYYRYSTAQISIPTWFGVELSAGIENLSGDRTDPTETIGRSNYIGISVPLAQNLLMDKRRAALQTAKIYQQSSEAERKDIINNLLLDAMSSYWNWMQSYQMYKVLDNIFQVNEKRVEFVKQSFRLGDRPAIDTTEAFTQLQTILVLRENAWAELQNARLDISQFLWSNDGKPVLLHGEAIPADGEIFENSAAAELPLLNNLVEAATTNHPQLVVYDFKLKALDVYKKLKFQQLLPVLNFKYNQLGKENEFLKENFVPMFQNNFQYGLSFGIPLRLSEGRGEYRRAKIQITETRLEQDYKRVQLETKVKTYYNELAALKKQIATQQLAYVNFVRLQRAEEARFQLGESSLFLINAREFKALEAFQKLQELRTRYIVTLNKLQWAAGLLV